MVLSKTYPTFCCCPALWIVEMKQDPLLQSAIASQLDNTALNAVRLLCSDGTEAITAEGEKGLWTDILKCQGHGNDYIVGVRVKSEKWLGVGRRHVPQLT